MAKIFTADVVVRLSVFERSEMGSGRAGLCVHPSQLALKHQHSFQHLQGCVSFSLETCVHLIEMAGHIHHKMQLFHPVGVVELWLKK